MARNKYPEKTIESILDTATHLFITKGYEKTSIQNIIDALDISKGAIYHHFKSKEDILEAVFARQTQRATEMFHNLVSQTKADNALKKLKIVIIEVLKCQDIRSFDGVAKSMQKNPRFLLRSITDNIDVNANLIVSIIEDGVLDGSIKTDYPLELAEVFMLLMNFWLNPRVFKKSKNETRNRLLFLQDMLYRLGLNVLDNEIMALTLSIYYDVEGDYDEE